MRYLYSFLLFMTRFDLAIAKATDRNPENIAQLQKEERKWEKELLLLEVNT